VKRKEITDAEFAELLLSNLEEDNKGRGSIKADIRPDW
jgi:hypothetical protein